MHVYSAREPSERGSWLDIWASSPGREPFSHPTFVELFAKPDQIPCVASFSQPGGGLLYPFILRPLSSEAWAGDDNRCDLISPYGYGGPFAWGTAVAGAREFWDLFDAWANQRGVVTSFTRLSLFEENLPTLPTPPTVLFGNVVRDLQQEEDALWRDYAHKVRKNVNRAERAGLVVEVDADGSSLDDFVRLYTSTMDRREAQESFYFTPAFFLRIVREMPGSFRFFNVLHEGATISTELVLCSEHTLYSFLGGTLAEHFDLRPNDLLKHRAILWGREEGLRRFVLGGGYGGDDGIFRYKLAFAPQGTTPFRVMRRVHDADAARELTALRQRGEPDWVEHAGFFPTYRG